MIPSQSNRSYFKRIVNRKTPKNGSPSEACTDLLMRPSVVVFRTESQILKINWKSSLLLLPHSTPVDQARISPLALTRESIVIWFHRINFIIYTSILLLLLCVLFALPSCCRARHFPPAPPIPCSPTDFLNEVSEPVARSISCWLVNTGADAFAASGSISPGSDSHRRAYESVGDRTGSC